MKQRTCKILLLLTCLIISCLKVHAAAPIGDSANQIGVDFPAVFAVAITIQTFVLLMHKKNRFVRKYKRKMMRFSLCHLPKPIKLWIAIMLMTFLIAPYSIIIIMATNAIAYYCIIFAAIVGITFAISYLAICFYAKRLLMGRIAYARLLIFACLQAVGYVVYNKLVFWLPPFKWIFRTEVITSFYDYTYYIEPSFDGLFVITECFAYLAFIATIIWFLLCLPRFVRRVVLISGCLILMYTSPLFMRSRYGVNSTKDVKCEYINTSKNGDSKDSYFGNIPYNRMRFKCLQTIYNRISSHPKDIFEINEFIILSQKGNIY